MTGLSSFTKVPVIRHIVPRFRLVACVIVGAVTPLLFGRHLDLTMRLLIGWNLAALFYIALTIPLMLRADEDSIRRRASDVDESEFAVLTLSIVATIATFIAIVFDLMAAKELQGAPKLLHLGLAGLTIVSAWSFIHLTFTLHYAHMFYAEGDGDEEAPHSTVGGLRFPGCKTPNYVDFIYYAYTIGVAAQTADVATTTRQMRRITIIHSILSFFFNTTVLALTINIAASLI